MFRPVSRCVVRPPAARLPVRHPAVLSGHVLFSDAIIAVAISAGITDTAVQDVPVARLLTAIRAAACNEGS